MNYKEIEGLKGHIINNINGQREKKSQLKANRNHARDRLWKQYNDLNMELSRTQHMP